jgi:AraC family transcriptional regulator
MGKQPRNFGKDPEPSFPYIENRNGVHVWRMQKDTEEQVVEVKTFPPMTLAYIRYTGPYKGDGALFEGLWNRLLSWAGARELLRPDTLYVALYHDDPELTDEMKLRVTVGLSVDEATAVSGEIGRMELEGGKYACAQFRLGEKDYQQAWEWVYSVWYPVSGYFPDDRPAFELFPQVQKHPAPDGRCRVDICVPVVPAP